MLPAAAGSVLAAPTTRLGLLCVVRVTPLDAGARWCVLVDAVADVVPDETGETRLTARVEPVGSGRRSASTVVTRPPLRTTGARRDGAGDVCFGALASDRAVAVGSRRGACRVVVLVPERDGWLFWLLPELGARRAGADLVFPPLRTAGARRKPPRDVCAGADALRPGPRARARARWSSPAAVARCGTLRKTAAASAIVNDVKRDMAYPLRQQAYLPE